MGAKTLVSRIKSVIQCGAQYGLATTLTGNECAILLMHIQDLEGELNNIKQWVSIDVLTPVSGDAVRFKDPKSGIEKVGWWNHGFFTREGKVSRRVDGVRYWRMFDEG